MRKSALNYTPVGRLPDDLTGPTGPIAPVLARLDPRLARPTELTALEFRQLVEFVRCERSTIPPHTDSLSTSASNPSKMGGRGEFASNPVH